jgi:D-arabinitol dehydrogenase (NADP+)
MGEKVKGFAKGNLVVADVGVMVRFFALPYLSTHNRPLQCGKCFYCRRGSSLLCENYRARGVSLPGGFAEYISYPASACYVVRNLSAEEATLIEPAACALHGLDKLALKPGSEVLLMGAGPTGLMLAQLLKMNGAVKVVLAANEGMKMDLAKKLSAADVYIELCRDNPQGQWEAIKKVGGFHPDDQ